MMIKMMARLFIMALLLLLSFNIFATTSWKDTFFTDDSPYYLKINKKGFTQRFRIDKKFCNQITSAEIIFKNDAIQPRQLFSPIPWANDWPKLFGIKESNYCWFQITVKGINFNRPFDNKYVIAVMDTRGNPQYFTGLTNSILPSKRIVDSINGERTFNWIDLGASGTTLAQDGGILFKLWEPNADEVLLYLEGSNTPIKMIPDGPKGLNSRSHVKFIPDAKLGLKYYYRFVKNGSYESFRVNNFKESSSIKIDPMSKGLHYDMKGGKYNGYVNPRSIITQYKEFQWKADNFLASMTSLEKDNWIIYELWPLTFNPLKDSKGNYRSGTFKSILEKVDYIANLGVTAVELMPINETRFYASMGYTPDSILLIEKNYGAPSDLMKLVDHLHERKIRVILDILINHLNNFLIRDPLIQTAPNSKFFSGQTEWGPKLNYENVMVQKFVAESLKSLVRDFHIDGLRFDMVKLIYQNNPVGYQFLQDLNQLLKIIHPNIYLSAEELPDNIWTTRPTTENGLGYDSQWNGKFKNFFTHGLNLYRQNNLSVNLDYLKAPFQGYSNHGIYGSEFKYNVPTLAVNSLGSHDFIGNNNPILRLVSDYSGLETNIYGNSYREFFRVRPLEDPKNTFYNFRLIHNSFTHSVGRLSYGALFTKPGAVLFFQGEELGNDLNIENEWSYLAPDSNNQPTQNIDLNHYIGSHRMPWEYLHPSSNGPLRFLSDYERYLFKGYNKFFKDLIAFRRAFPGINQIHAKNVSISYNSTILTYELHSSPEDKSPEDKFFVVLNFGRAKNGIWLPFPSGTDSWWEEIYNSSSHIYSGNRSMYNNVISNLGGRTNSLRMGASSILIFKERKNANINTPLYLMGNINNWQKSSDFKLTKKSDRGEVYGVVFKVSHPGQYEFKIATSNWDIEMGQAMSSDKASEDLSSEDAGILGYVKDLPNLKIGLDQGSYKFLFNLRTFKYKFIKI